MTLKDLAARLDALEARVKTLEGKDEEPAADDWAEEYRRHVEAQEASARADLIRRTRTGMQSTSSGP